MKYFLLITDADGETRLVPITDKMDIEVAPGDDVVVMDENGDAVDVSLRPEGADLVLDFDDGTRAILKEFYANAEDAEPITISLNPVEPVPAQYEFNSQTGNLPQSKDFTLMRFSNTEYVELVEQLDELKGGLLPGRFANGSLNGGGAGDEEEGPGCCEEDLPGPGAAPDEGQGTHGGPPIVLNLLANDSDPLAEGLEIHAIGGIGVIPGESVTLASGTVVDVGENGEIEVTPGESFAELPGGESGTETFIYSIIDNDGNIATSEVTVTVAGVNDPPVAVEDEFTLEEDAPVTVNVLENDSDPDAGDVLTVTGISSPPSGQVSINPDNTVTFDPQGEFEELAVGETETVTLTYTISDGAGETATSTVTFVVEGRNDSPDAIDDDRSTSQGTPVVIDALANDIDPDASDSLSIVGVTQPTKGQALYNNNGNITFDPGDEFDELDAGESETVTFTYDIDDGNGGTDTATVTVTVVGAEDPTVTAPDEARTDEESAVFIDVLENDSDIDASDNPLEVDEVSQPIPGSGSVLNVGSGVVFDPGNDFESLAEGESATSKFTYTTDTGEVENVFVIIDGVNDGPTAIDDVGFTDQDSSLTVDALDNDFDPDTSDKLLITGVDQPGKGSVTLDSASRIVFHPGDEFEDLDSGESETVTFDYRISDGHGGIDTATVTITVTGAEDTTLTNPDVGITDEDSAITIDVLANDSDVDASDNPLAVAGVDDSALPGDASVTNNGADVTFDPGTAFTDLAVGESATTTFTYTTSTGVTETVTITVTGTNDGPVAVNDIDSVDEDATITVDAANGVIQGPGTDTDLDGSDVLEVSAIRTGPESGTGTGALVGNPLEGTYGTLTLNSDGSYSYTADQDAADPLSVGVTATDTFTYEISDGNGDTDTAELVITVTGTNDAPLPNPPGGTPGVDPGVYDDEDTITEDAVAPATGNVLANDVDLDSGDTLEVSEVNGVAGDVGDPVTGTYGTVTINQDGSYSYALDNGNPTVQALAVGESTTDTFTYTADDGNGGSASATLTITITGANDVPPSNPPGGTPGVDFGVYDDADSIAEDAFPNTTGGNVLSNDLDPDGDALTVAEVDGSTANVGSQVTGNFGAVIIGNDGSYQYVLDNSNPAVQALAVGESTTDTFTYTADDGNGGAATATLTITITGTNDGPTAVDDSGTGDEDNDITGNVITNDTDIDGDSPLVVVGNTDPSNGSVTVAPNGAYTYTPDPDFSGTDSFTYTIEDPSGATDTATVTLTVNPVNDPPVGVDDAGTTGENNSVTIGVLPNDTDTEGDTLTVTSIDDSGLTGGSATLNGDNTITFDPGTDFENLAVGETATETLTYVVEDGNGGSDTATVTITVEGENDDPVAVDDTGVGDEDMSITGNVVTNDTDVDGDTPLTVVSNTTPAHGTLAIAANGAYTYTPDPDYNGLDSFTYTIEDPNGGSDTATVTLTINPANDPPIAVDDSDSTTENAVVTIDVLDNDTDIEDDTLTVTSIDDSGLTGGSATLNGDSTVTFDPGSDFDSLAVGETATETLTYVVEDGNGGSDTATITVTIEGQNDVPVAVDDTDSVNEDATITVGAANGVIQGPGTDTDLDGTDVLEVSAVRTGAESGAGTGALVGNPLVGTYGTLTLNSDGGYTYTADQDAADELSAGVTASDTFTYEISDGNGGTDTAELVITVTGVDDATATNPDSAVTDEDTSIVVDVLANDTDPDAADNPLSVSSVGATSGGKGVVTITNGGQDVTFDPDGDFEDLAVGESETVTFDYTTNTGATETATITVEGRNDTPVAVDDTESVSQDGSTNIDLLGAGDSTAADSDPDGDSLSVLEVDGSVAGGTVNLTSGAVLTLLADGTANYDPNGSFDYLDDGESATDTFDYTIADGNGGTATATVTVTVSGVDDALEAESDIASTTENATVDIDVLANDEDPDVTDNPLSVQSTSQPARGSVVNNGNDVTFDPGADFDDLMVGESATTSFSYTVENQDGATEVETVTVTVVGENDGPETHEDTLHTMEGVGRSVDVIQNDSDPDSPQLTITEINGVAVNANEPISLSSGAIVTVMEDGRVYFNPNGVYNPLGFGETGTESFTYTVEDSEGATATEDVSVIIDGVDNEVIFSGAYQVLSNQLYDIQLDPVDESVVYVPIGDPLPFNFNSIAFNSNDGLIYANATGDDAGSGVSDGDLIRINPFSGEVVDNLGQFVNDQGESVPSYAGAINADLGTSGIYYVNGPSDSSGNTTYAIDLGTMTVTGIGDLPGADYGVDVTTGLIWSINGTNSYSLDPTSGVVTTYSHGGLQEDGSSAANGTWGSVFADGDGNIQATSNSGYGLYRLETSTGSLTRVTDAPATNSNDATGTFVSTLPSASPFLFLDADESTQPATNQDAVRGYDPNGAPVSIADTDAAIADLDGNTIASARIVLTNTLTNDLLTINGPLPGGITGTVAMEGGFLVATLSGNASQQDYADAIEAVTFSNTSTGSVPTDVRAIEVTVTDIDGVRSNKATSLVFVGAGTGTISGRDVQSEDDAYADSLVLTEDDNDPATGGARLDLLQNDSDNPSAITGVSQPPAGEGSVTNNGDGTATFNPGDDFHYLSEGETAITSFTYSTDTGETETVTVTVHGVDDPLEADPDFASTSATESVTIDVLANDEDPDDDDIPLTLNAVTQPPSGSVSIVDNKAVFDPGDDFDGLAIGESATVTFIYTVTNVDGVDENELVTVTVHGSTDPAPVAADDSGTTDEGSSTTIDVLANDTDPEPGDTLTVVGLTQPPSGSVTSTGTDIVFDPDGDFEHLGENESATVSFSYTVGDDNGATDTATVTVTIDGENDVPTASADLINTDRDEPVTFAPLANDSDIDGDSLTVSRIDGTNVSVGDTVTLASGAQVTLNAGGTFTYTANGNYDSIRSGDLLGEDSFTYRASDGHGGHVTETATVVLTPQLLLANGALGYATSDQTPDLYTFIPDTSTVPTAETNTLSQVFDGEGMTMRPTTGMVIVFDDTSQGDLYHIDPNTNASTFIGTTGIEDVQGAAFFVDSVTLEETLYVLGNGSGEGGGEIFKVDPDTGAVDPNGFGAGVDRLTLSGDISELSSLTVDPATGLGWGTDDRTSSSTYDGETSNPDLYTVDLTTGDTTFVAGLPNGIDGESLAFAVDGKLYTEDEGSPKTIYEIDKSDGSLTDASIWSGSGDVEGMAFNAFFNLFAPAVDLDSTAAGDDYTGTYSGAPVSVASINSDLDSERTDEVLMATVTLTNPEAGDSLNIGTLPGTITGGQTTDESGQLVVTLYVTNGNTGTIADFETAIEAVTFDNSLDSPDTTDRVLEVRIMDTDGTLSEPATSTIEIAVTPPVVVDMDGDGVEFDGIEDGIALDVDGDGELEQTAWADEDDAVLVYDQNNNDDVDGLDEFAFSRYSDDPNATDLEGLRHFDSNDDLILDANDAEFDSFKLWQDKDGDGTVDEGEMRTLSEAGIESLELTSDGESYNAAGGDVQVHGEAGVRYADGSEGVLADAAFQYEEMEAAEELEVVTGNGDVLDVNDSDTEFGEATPDLLEEKPVEGGEVVSGGNEPVEGGGASSGPSIDDDMAAADAAMS